MATNAFTTRLVRTGRVSGLALACVLIGTTAYAAIAWQSGPITYEYLGENVRLTQEDFDSWRGIVPAPEISERSYREVRLRTGEWVKEGQYGRRTRDGIAQEEGTYRAGLRCGRWTFWNPDGSLDVGRSGFYSDDVRVKPGPTSNTELQWVFGGQGS